MTRSVVGVTSSMSGGPLGRPLSRQRSKKGSLANFGVLDTAKSEEPAEAANPFISSVEDAQEVVAKVGADRTRRPWPPPLSPPIHAPLHLTRLPRSNWRTSGRLQTT